MYPLYSAHRYAHTGNYEATLNVFVKCSGSGSEISKQAKSTVQVFEHIPVKKFSCKSALIKKGEPLILTLELVAAAPASGTRVALEASNATGVFRDRALPGILTIPPDSDHISLRIPTLKTAPTATVTLTVIAINGRYTEQIKIE